MYKISRFEYLGKHIAYVSVVEGDAYISIHNRYGLTDAQARVNFLIEHYREVDYLRRQKMEQQDKKNDGKILIP